MADGSIVIDTKVDTSGAEKGVKGLSSGLGALAKKAVPIAAVAATVKKLATELYKTAEVYKVQAKAETQLAVAAKNNPYLDEASVQQLKSYAGELQSISTIGDEQLLPYMAQLAASGRTQAEIQNIMKAAVDASASGTIDLGTAVRSLNQSYEGSAGALERVLPSLKNLTAEDMKNGAAVREVAKAYDGMAKKTAEATGSAEQLNNAWGDFKENIGSTVEKTLAPMRRKLTELLTDINNATAEKNARKQADEDIKNAAATTATYETKIKEADSQIATLKERMVKASAMGDKLSEGELNAEIKQLEAIKVSYNIEKNKLIAKQQSARTAEEEKQAEKEAQDAAAKRLDDAVAAKNAYTDAVNQAKKEIEIRRAMGEEISAEEEQQEILNAKTSAFMELQTHFEDYNNIWIDGKNVLDDIVEDMNKLADPETTEEIADNTEILNKAFTELAQSVNSALADTFSMASDAVGKQSEAEIQELENDYNRGLISEEEYLDKKADLEEEAAEKQYKLDMISWALQISQATANAAMAVSSVWGDSTIPVVTKPIYAAIAAVNGAASLASVIAAKPVKKYATGGIIDGTSYSGDNVIARVNSGEMILNQKQQQNLFNALNSGTAGGGTNITMPVNIVNNTDSKVSTQMDAKGLTVLIDQKVNASMVQGKYTESMQIAESREKGAKIL